MDVEVLVELIGLELEELLDLLNKQIAKFKPKYAYSTNPTSINDLAEKNKVNFSQVLQTALKNALGLKR